MIVARTQLTCKLPDRTSLGENARAMGDIEGCRTAYFGGHLQQCDHRGRKVFAYHSCHNRHCPKCHRWLQKQRARMSGRAAYLDAGPALPSPRPSVRHRRRAFRRCHTGDGAPEPGLPAAGTGAVGYLPRQAVRSLEEGRAAAAGPTAGVEESLGGPCQPARSG